MKPFVLGWLAGIATVIGGLFAWMWQQDRLDERGRQ